VIDNRAVSIEIPTIRNMDSGLFVVIEPRVRVRNVRLNTGKPVVSGIWTFATQAEVLRRTAAPHHGANPQKTPKGQIWRLAENSQNRH